MPGTFGATLDELYAVATVTGRPGVLIDNIVAYPDKLAYAARIGVGETREEGYRRADLLADYARTAPVVAEPFTNPPGYNSIPANVAMLKSGGKGCELDRKGNPIDNRTATVEQFMATDTVFAGTPDDVYNQIKDFNERVGGFGHLLFFGQGGHLSHEDTLENIRLFGAEVLPRLAKLNPYPGQQTAAAE